MITMLRMAIVANYYVPQLYDIIKIKMIMIENKTIWITTGLI